MNQKIHNKQIQQCIVNLTDQGSRIDNPGFISLRRTGSKCWLHNTSDHDIFDCHVFRNTDVEGRIE